MDRRSHLARALAALLLLAGCTAEQTAEPAAPATGGNNAFLPATEPALPAPAPPQLDPALLLDHVAAIDSHGLALAEQATNRPMTEAATDFAASLRQDHAAGLDATRALQERLGAAPGPDLGPVPQPVPQPAAGGEEPQEVLARLAGLADDQYQRAWIDAVVGAHTAALEQLDNTLVPAAGDDDIRGHLEDTRRSLARHLETAQRLREASQ